MRKIGSWYLCQLVVLFCISCLTMQAQNHPGGARYWKPSHGAYSTFWNIDVRFSSRQDQSGPFVLNGMKDGPFANVVGVQGNHEIEIKYGPHAWIEFSNQDLGDIPSLYDYQPKKRLANSSREY